MKRQLLKCTECNDETSHMVGKKLGHKGDKHYATRTTSQCVVCGKKEIANKTTGKRIIQGKNETK